MSDIHQLLINNKQWASDVKASDPEFFERLATQQRPEYLWIGCSDSRVPANEIVGLLPGEIFVHRNVANLVIHTDFNCMSVIEYAVAVLKVKHIIVCGHYGCGGVKAATQHIELGLIDNWLRNIKDIYARNRRALNELENDDARVNMLCELNVSRQVKNVAYSHAVQKAWLQEQPLQIHGWIYDIRDGVVKDLKLTKTSLADLEQEYKLNPDW